MNFSKLVLVTLFSSFSLIACNQQTTDKESVSSDVVNHAETEVTVKKPNILLIVADDLGFTDLGSFGGDDIATPNLDSLAQQGMKLTNFHTAPTCSPTRSMLLTGVDNHSAGMGAMGEALRGTTNLAGKKGYEGYLTDRAASLPEVLKSAGYNTYMAGKWHLGLKDDQSPTARGFDKTFTLLDGGAGHFDDLGLMFGTARYRENGKKTSLPENFYSSEFYTRKIQEYLAMNKGTGKPFFAYAAYTAPHWPLQALPETMELYRGKYDEGYDKLHSARIKGAKEAGVIPADSPATIPHTPWMTPWDELSDEEKKFESRRMEIYAAMVHDLDVYIGQLIDTLKELGELDNTVIFFMSDNGAEGSDVDTTMRMVAPYIEKCCNNDFDNLGKADSYIYVGPNWARASVGASSYYKGTTAEGGIKTPAFIIYPDMEGASTTSSRFVTVKDVMPTILELAGIEEPKDTFNGRPVLPIEGKSMLKEQDEDTVEMAWELHGNKAVRFGYWKIVSLKGFYGDGSWKLYNVKDDPGEQNDLAATNPEMLAKMVARWDEYELAKGIIEPEFKH
jgi:arylsulfatase